MLPPVWPRLNMSMRQLFPGSTVLHREDDPESGWSRSACRYVYSATSVRRRRSDRRTDAGVTEVQGDGRFPESGETGARSEVRSGTTALLAAQVPREVRPLRA